jgi:hypothetical protein
MRDAWSAKPDIEYMVRLPAAFEAYFSGTGVAQGTDVATPSTVAAYEAWQGAVKVKAGGGHSWMVTGTRQALNEIRDIVQNFLNLCGPGFSSDKEERAAAREWVRRINNILYDWPDKD